MKEYKISKNDADQRLDKFLKKLFVNASLSLIYKLVRKGNIKIINQDGDKTKQKKEYKLIEGEVVQVYLSDNDIKNISEQKELPVIGKSGNKLNKEDIAFEDDDILVVNKNPGTNVHPGDNKTTEVSLIEQVEDYYKGKLNSHTFKPSLIHRIDRDTSGIVMIAKKKDTLTKLSADFKNHTQLKKTYFCIVLGKMSRKSGIITKKLQRIENAKNENKVQVSEKGLEAITHYKLLDEYTIHLPQGEQILSCLEVTIETGRMHQIRVHMAALGNPILGDKHYGDKSLNSYFSKNYHITRQMLHAWKIEFFHPEQNKMMSVEARLKNDMKSFISKLKK